MRLTLAGALGAVAAAAPAAAFAVDYLSAEQAARLMFPDADRFETRELNLDAAELQALDAQGVRSRSARWSVQLAQHAGQPLGVVVTDDVVGKFELISYAVGIGLDGTVKQIEILSYRESHGGEVRQDSWRKQFAGKSGDAALRVGDDISNISGATLSCTHVADGVRRIAAVLSSLQHSGALK